MKNRMRVATIVLLIVTLALAAGGVAGVGIARKAAASAASPYAQYGEDYAAFSEEGRRFLSQAELALKNIGGYVGQIEANRALLAERGADTAPIDELLSDAQAQLASAEGDFESMKGQMEKLNNAGADVGEDSPADALEGVLSKASKYRNAIQRNLKKITRIEAAEATRSYETIAAQDAAKVVELISAAQSDLELGPQFTAEPFAVETQSAQAQRRSFADFLAQNSEYLFWLAGCALLATALCLIGAIRRPTLKKIGEVANKNMMLVALIVITLIFFVLTNYTILTPTNVSNIINQNAYIIILACGMLLCIICSGNIDLSVGRVIGFVGACAAKFMITGKMNTGVSIVLCLIIGILIGAWQGFWIAYMHIPAFIVTLAGQLTFYGLSMMILQGFTIAGFPVNFQTMFCAYIGDPLRGSLFGLNSLALLVGVIAAVLIVILQIRARAQRRRKGYALEPMRNMVIRTVVVAAVVLWLFYSLAKARGIPTVLITVCLVLLIYTYITSKTVLGRHLYAMGGNVNAARLSGVKTQKMLFLAYVNMGLLAALAGLVYAARLNAASPQAGSGDELYAIASCYIGGASAYGGIGTVGGALIGALTMGVIKNGMSIMGLGQDIQQIVLGMVLLVAVVIDVVSKQNITLPFSFRSKHKKT